MDLTAPIPLSADLQCGGCGQNLRGVASDRCPECGRNFDRSQVRSGAIPWELRTDQGTFVGYWRTVGAVCFHPRRVARAARAARAVVSAAAARQFRRRTVLIVCLPVLIALTLEREFGNTVFLNYLRRDGTWLGQSLDFLYDYKHYAWTAWGAIPAMFALCEVISLFFRRAGDAAAARAAMAVSYYSCAPLAGYFILAVFILIGVLIDTFMRLGNGNGLPWSSFENVVAGLTAAIVLWWLIASLLMLRPATGCARWKVVALTVTAPLAAACLFGACVIGVTYAVDALRFLAAHGK